MIDNLVCLVFQNYEKRAISQLTTTILGTVDNQPQSLNPSEAVKIHKRLFASGHYETETRSLM